jgi:hypothetical protein
MDVGVERPRRKDINSPYSAVEKNKWSCTSTPHVPCGVHKKILTLTFSVCWGRTVTEAVGRRPFNAEACLKFQVSVCVCVCVRERFYDGQIRNGTGFLRSLRFHPVSLIPPVICTHAFIIYSILVEP